MLPPCFWALAGAANSATPNPATRNIRANAFERIAAFIRAPSRMHPSGIPDRWMTPADWLELPSAARP
jgi:hypothetical protein